VNAPIFAPVDEPTADLLALVALGSSTGTADAEWDLYVDALATVAARHAGLIFPNELRQMVRGKVAPKRLGALTHRALKRGIVRRTGDWQTSDDHEGRNAGRPVAVMEWIGGETA
jgi:hypothetical protein